MPQRSLVDYLPQEIIDKILDKLCMDPLSGKYDPLLDDNLPALKACSLVSRTFAPRCQYHLFSTLKLGGLDFDDDPQRREAIYNILVSKPHIINGVRHVSVSLGPKGMKSVVSKEDITEPGLLLFLRELPISSIKIASYSWVIDDDYYPNPRAIEKYFIRPFIQTTFIKSLDISFAIISASILARFPNLEELSLLVPEFELSKDYTKISAHQPRALLRILEISGPSILEEVLRVCGSDALPLFDLSRLRVLQTPFSVNDKDELMLSRAFDICAQSLEELIVHGNFNTMEASWSVYNLGRFPKLTVLHLKVGFLTIEEDTSPAPTNSEFIDYCHLLATIRSANALRRMDIDIHIRCAERLPPLRCLEIQGWDELDHEAMRISGGKALKLNLSIEWVVARHNATVVRDENEETFKENLRVCVEEILGTSLVPAIREKFQRVRQSPWINFNVKIGSCYVVYLNPPSNTNIS